MWGESTQAGGLCAEPLSPPPSAAIIVQTMLSSNTQAAGNVHPLRHIVYDAAANADCPQCAIQSSIRKHVGRFAVVTLRMITLIRQILSFSSEL